METVNRYEAAGAHAVDDCGQLGGVKAADLAEVRRGKGVEHVSLHAAHAVGRQRNGAAVAALQTPEELMSSSVRAFTDTLTPVTASPAPEACEEMLAMLPRPQPGPPGLMLVWWS
jgi:hypothetical protein